MRMPAAVLAATLALVLPAPAAAQNASDCSVLGQNSFVYDTMKDSYYWYREMPVVSPAAFAGPQDVLQAVRYQPLDHSFSFINESQAADQAFYSDSQFIGFGFRNSLRSDDDWRVVEVYPNSPAFEAGLRRGHQILAVDGVPLRDLVASEAVGGAFGPSEIGVVRTVTYRDLAGAEATTTMTKRIVDIPTVSNTQFFDVGGRKVAYFLFGNFVRPAELALNVAFAQFQQLGVNEVVLDLRYNGGGLVSIAQQLASLIGGSTTSGQVFCEFSYNDRYAAYNQVYRFSGPAQGLGLPRLFVLTTRSSASASELVINALRPFMPVVVVGDNTYGKPVGQSPHPFCGKVLYPVEFALRNAAGQGDFFNGFTPTCPAPDDLTHQLGDREEGSLATALQYIATGSCPAAAAAELRAQAARRPRGLRQPHAGDGWQELLGAY